MPTLYLGSSIISDFDSLTAQTGVIWAVYGFAVLVVLSWIIVSMRKSRGLISHRNAVTLRGVVNFLRTADPKEKQIEDLMAEITKARNDVAMLFYMYCRIHSNFKFIDSYLTYRVYKRINRKRKPWGFTTVVITSLLIALVFSISYWYHGYDALINQPFDLPIFLLGFIVPVGLFVIWFVIRLFILMKYKMYWVEFENKFKKVSELSRDFFASQEDYYEEFSEIVLATLAPTGATMRRIEKIIARTDVSAFEGKATKAKKAKKPEDAKAKDKDVEKDSDENDQANQQGGFGYPAGMPPMGGSPGMPGGVPMPPMPMQPSMPHGARIARPHPETEAYLQAHAAVTQQLMQMMMQQSMQQSQVMQRALSSQQALANSVVQQNIMAMRLEAQQTSLLRPDLAKRLSEQTYVWPTNKPTLQTNTEDDIGAKADKIDATPTPEPMMEDHDKKPAEAVVEAEVIVQSEPEAAVKKGKSAEKLMKAFEMLSPPPKAGGEPDPVFVAPDREPTNVEKRLEQFFTAKVYVYDQNSEGGI